MPFRHSLKGVSNDLPFDGVITGKGLGLNFPPWQDIYMLLLFLNIGYITDL